MLTTYRLPMLFIPLLAAIVPASPVQASVVSLTANVPGINLYTLPTTSAGNVSFGKLVSAEFAGFDTTLGTLTGVSFAYDYQYTFVFINEGPGGGSGGLNSPLRINGTPFLYSSGGGPSFVSLDSSGDFAVTGTAEADVLSVPLSTYASAYTFDLLAAGGFGGGGGPGHSMSSSLDLRPSSVTVTYTFDDAPQGGSVPEPSSLALVGACSLAFALRRRRTTAHQ